MSLSQKPPHCAALVYHWPVRHVEPDTIHEMQLCAKHLLPFMGPIQVAKYLWCPAPLAHLLTADWGVRSVLWDGLEWHTVLCCAVLCCAVLCCAVLSSVVLCRAAWWDVVGCGGVVGVWCDVSTQQALCGSTQQCLYCSTKQCRFCSKDAAVCAAHNRPFAAVPCAVVRYGMVCHCIVPCNRVSCGVAWYGVPFHCHGHGVAMEWAGGPRKSRFELYALLMLASDP